VDTNGKNTVTQLHPNPMRQTSADVQADKLIKVAIRVRATWSDGSVDKTETEAVVSRRPHIALLDAAPGGKVTQVFPDPMLTTSSDKQRLAVTGEWFYLGRNNELLPEASLVTPDKIAVV